MNEVLATPKNLAEWKESGLQLIKALRVRGEEEAFRRLLSDLYPDTAHFIFELLQNAEDTKATSVNFILNAEQLEFMHNGDRLFSESDVKAITSFGNSTKRDDETSIGKFGVGFKAVFAYTDTPEIHSGDFHFQIYDLVVPEFDHVPQLPMEGNKTNFIFPFNNPKKPASLAVSEIKKGLCALGDNTLLFLSHIRKISYSLPDGSQGSLERIDHENGRIEIKTKHPHQEESISNWLHFYKDVIVINTDDGKEQIFRVAIAYQLEQIIDKNKTETWKIVPVSKWQVSKGQVSIYFPAEKEKSGLRFHIHAPFASTVARDVVRSCDENDKLLDHIADLIVESLELIKSQGLLTLEFLAVLPNNTDELGDFYKPIQEKIIHQFKYSLLTPTKYGDYSSACFLYQSSPTFSNLISNTDLKLLINDEYAEHADWVANARQRNSREDKFLDSLQIDKFEFDNLFQVFNKINTTALIIAYPIEDQNIMDTYQYNKIKRWFEQKDDKWIKQFYTLLSDDKENSWASQFFPFVRTNSADGIKHVRGSEAYFEPSIQENFENILIVKREVYTKDKANNNFDENAVSFLKSIGVRPFDEKAAIELRLNFYKKTPPKRINDQYYDDIKWFIRYWKENRTEFVYLPRKVEKLFKRVRFFLGVSNDSISWKTATEICLDSPIMETGLSELVAIHGKSPIYSKYSKNLTIDELKDFVEFLKAIGVMYQLEITRLNRSDSLCNPNNPYKSDYYVDYNWTENARIDDYSIENLGDYLMANSVLASRLVWNAIINSDNRRVQVAGFQPNRKYNYKEVDSSLISMLKDYDWIPTKSGEFRNPRAMTRDDLRDDFPFNNNNGLLTAIEFGKYSEIREAEENKRKEQQKDSFKQKQRLAKELGAESVDEVKEAIKLFNEIKNQGKTIEEVRAIFNPKKPDFEDDYSSNPSRRAEKLKEDALNSPKKLKEVRLRSVSDGEYEKVKQMAKEYLKDRYTINDVLYCQICRKEMPFKLSDGSYYFEAVSLINDTEKSYKYNFIALCPIDAAKFKFANTSRNNMKMLIKEIIENRTPEEINNNDNGKNYIELVLADNSEVIEFTPKHLGDIKSTLDN